MKDGAKLRLRGALCLRTSIELVVIELALPHPLAPTAMGVLEISGGFDIVPTAGYL